MKAKKKRTSKQTISRDFSHSIFIVLLSLFSRFLDLGCNTAKVWWRLFIWSPAENTEPFKQPIPKFINNVRFGNIRHATAHTEHELWFTASMEPNVAVQWPFRGFLRCATVGIDAVPTKYDAKQFEFVIVINAGQSQYVVLESFIIGQYARLRYTASVSRCHSARQLIDAHIIATFPKYLRHSRIESTKSGHNQRVAIGINVRTRNSCQIRKWSNGSHKQVS